MKTLMRNGRDRRSENPVMGHARKERVGLFGTDQRITSGPAARRPHSKAEYMTAPERFADSQIPLAPRAPSIHPYMTQSVASRQIQALEDELGVRLFARIGRSARLTSEGEDLLMRSRRLLFDAEALGQRASALKTGEVGVLRVGATPQVIE